MGLKIRNYEPKDLENVVKLINRVVSELDAKSSLYTPDKLKEEQEYQSPAFNNERYKLLVAEDKIVGFAECFVTLENYYLEYPLILPEYRNQENLDMLFNETYNFAVLNNAQSIRSICFLNFLKEDLKYFENQTVSDIKEIQEVKQITIPIEGLNYNLDGFELKPLTVDNMEKLVQWQMEQEGVFGEKLTIERIKERIEKNEFSSEKSFIIYKNGKILGFISVDINEPPHSPYSMNRYYNEKCGTLNGILISTDYPDFQELRKAYLKGGYPFFKKNGVKEFRTSILVTDELKTQQFIELGFKMTGEGEKIFIYK